MKIKQAKFEELHAQLERHGVAYGLGAKAGASVKPDNIAKIDCSGYVRYMVLNCSDLTEFRDGSQNQREWCEKNLRKVEGGYKDVIRYGGERMFICFIKPFTNGCGKVGHVWFVHDGETYESCGGRGVTNRPVDTGVLRRECFNCFEVELV